MNYYEILGVGKDADAEAIKKAYRKLSSKHHPDKNPDDKDAHEKMLAIREAYDVLSDPEKRRQYDETGTVGSSSLDEQATILVAQMFELFIEKDNGIYDPLPNIIRGLTEAMTQVDHSSNKSERKLQALIGRRGAIKLKKKAKRNDVFSGLLESKINNMRAQIATLANERRKVERALEILEDYESSLATHQRSVFDMRTTGVWTAT